MRNAIHELIWYSKTSVLRPLTKIGHIWGVTVNQGGVMATNRSTGSYIGVLRLFSRDFIVQIYTFMLNRLHF